jgi:hypothetical protein
MLLNEIDSTKNVYMCPYLTQKESDTKYYEKYEGDQNVGSFGVDMSIFNIQRKEFANHISNIIKFNTAVLPQIRQKCSENNPDKQIFNIIVVTRDDFLIQLLAQKGIRNLIIEHGQGVLCVIKNNIITLFPTYNQNNENKWVTYDEVVKEEFKKSDNKCA